MLSSLDLLADLSCFHLSLRKQKVGDGGFPNARRPRQNRCLSLCQHPQLIQPAVFVSTRKIDGIAG